MMRIDLENHQYVDMVLIPPMAPFYDCAVRLEFGDHDNQEFGFTKAFSVDTEQLGQIISFLETHDTATFFEFQSEPNLMDGTRTVFKFMSGGDSLSVIDKGEIRTIPFCFRRIVLLEALKHYCAEALRG